MLYSASTPARELPADLDAVSLVPVLLGATLSVPRDLYFVRREGGPAYGGKSYAAIIRNDWKLLQNSADSPMELYNLKTDPHEKNNSITTYRKTFNELSECLRERRISQHQSSVRQ
jgi:hypothetical protein